MEKFSDTLSDECTQAVVRVIQELIWSSKLLRNKMRDRVSRTKTRIPTTPRRFLFFLDEAGEEETQREGEEDTVLD